MGYRWSSIERRGHLHFRWCVARLPGCTIQYAVVHDELTHLVKREHTDDFRLRLEWLVTDYGEHQRWLAGKGMRYVFERATNGLDRDTGGVHFNSGAD